MLKHSLALVIALLLAAPAHAATTLAYYARGDAAPGTGETFSTFTDFALNASGAVTFTASITGPFNQNSTVWQTGAGGSSPALVAREGDTAPGSVSTFTNLNVSPNLGDGPNTSFLTSLSALGTAGVYRNALGVLAEVAEDGDAAPGGGTFLNIDRTSTSGPVPVNAAGEVVVHGQLDGGGNPEGIWAGTPGALSLVALVGDPAPGYVDFHAIDDHPMISDTHVVFDSTVTTGGSPSTTIAIYQATTSPLGAPTLVVDGLGSGINSIDLQSVNDAEQVVFTGKNGLNDQQLSTATAGGAVTVIAVEGEVAPGTGGNTFVNFGAAAIRDNGDVAFRGVLLTGVVQGLWYWERATDTLSLIAAGGLAAPGGGTFDSGGFANLSVRGTLNNQGEIAFLGLLESGDRGFWVGRPGALRRVVLEGLLAPGTAITIDGSLRFFDGFQAPAPYALSGLEDGLPGGFNDAGDLAFRFTSNGGTEEYLFVVNTGPTVPVMGAGGLVVLAIAMLGSLRATRAFGRRGRRSRA